MVPYGTSAAVLNFKARLRVYSFLTQLTEEHLDSAPSCATA